MDAGWRLDSVRQPIGHVGRKVPSGTESLDGDAVIPQGQGHGHLVHVHGVGAEQLNVLQHLTGTAILCIGHLFQGVSKHKVEHPVGVHLAGLQLRIEVKRHDRRQFDVSAVELGRQHVEGRTGCIDGLRREAVAPPVECPRILSEHRVGVGQHGTNVDSDGRQGEGGTNLVATRGPGVVGRHRTNGDTAFPKHIECVAVRGPTTWTIGSDGSTPAIPVGEACQRRVARCNLGFSSLTHENGAADVLVRLPRACLVVSVAVGQVTDSEVRTEPLNGPPQTERH
jgi:hypothetical protein